MDFDSSAKFISSLAKFLQSLCNGYVEFDNGVEVIGHIYLNVDTGKKIDYVLNEKVCKTDENSVTFISNSFHAQPAEKPKPAEKPATQNEPSEQASDNDIILMDDPDKSFEQFNDDVHQNSSTLQSRKRSHGASKRSFSQSLSSNRLSKAPKLDSTLSNPNGVHLHSSNNSTNDSSFNLNVSGNITAASESDLSHLSQVFPESVSDSNLPDRDVKPPLDKELNVIKQEYDPSTNCQGDDNSYVQGDDSYYSQNQSYESANDQYYGGSHQVNSQKEYDLSKVYMGDASQSSNTGDTQGEPLDYEGSVWIPGQQCPVKGCAAMVNRRSRYVRHWTEVHQYMVRKFACHQCSATFKRKEKLRLHETVKHGGYDGRSSPQMELDEVNRQYVDPWPLTLEKILGWDSQQTHW